MTRKTKKIILIAIIAIACTGIVTGYMLWNKPHKDVESADAVKITSTDLYNIFITDSSKARSSYTDKVLLVSGEISNVSINQQSQQVIFIKTTVAGAFINCTMEGKAEGLKAGDHVTIKGICSGYISGDADMGLPGDVFLIRGYLFNGK
jgi:hypothetical protein